MSDNNFWSVGDGMVLGGAFWSDVAKETPIDELLNRLKNGENVALERFLDEKLVLQEVTAPNTDLVNFLIEHLAEMIDYITLGRKRKPDEFESEHPHTSEHYAYISCEILSANSPAIMGAILRSDELLERLFQILNEPGPLSPRSTGYFHMVLLLLCQNDPSTILKFVSKDRPVSIPTTPVAVDQNKLEPDELSQDPSLQQKEVSLATSSSASATTPGKDEEARGAKRALEAVPVEPVTKKTPVSVTGDVQISFQAPAAELPNLTARSSPPIMRHNMGMVPLFLRHVDSYSVACAFMVLLQAAAGQLDLANEAATIAPVNRLSNGQGGSRLSQSNRLDTPELIRARRLWMGAYGTSEAVFLALKERDDPYSHSNAADLLVELFRRASSARKSHLESQHMANLHAADDEQQAPFAMSDEEIFADQFGNASLSAPVALTHSISQGVNDENWTLPLVDDLCTLISEAPQLSSATDSATRVLSAMVLAYSQPFSGNGDAVVTKQDTCPEIERILRRLPGLVGRLIPANGEQDFIQTQWGGRVARLGMGRLLLVELVSNLITCGYKSVAQEMSYMDPEPVKAFLDLFFLFEWNNVLHSIVEKTLKAILLGQTPAVRAMASAPSKDAQEQVLNNQKAEAERLATVDALFPLQKSLFGSSPNLIERILDAYDSNAAAVRVVEERYVQTSRGGVPKADENVPRHGQKGYMGHLREIANACAELIETQNERGGPGFDALGEGTALRQRWYDFVNGKLAECNQLVSKPLGGTLVKKESHVLAGLEQMGQMIQSSFSDDAFRRKPGLDLDEDNFEDDDDDDDDEDSDETMARYYKRKEQMMTEKAFLARDGEGQTIGQASSPEKDGSHNIIASSPQDSSWVVDFANDFGESGNAEGGGAVFGSPSTYDPGFFNPHHDLLVATASWPQKHNGQVQQSKDEEADLVDFDPFGASEPSNRTSSAPQAIATKAAPPSQPALIDFGGVTPPGFEVIEKM